MKNNLENIQRENKFQLIAMDQHNIVSTTDISGRIISVNDKFCEISGYSREELLGQNHRMIKSGHHSESFYKSMWGAIGKGKVWHGTICNRKKNGGEYWVESTITPFLNDKGVPYKYVSVRTDVTHMKQTEASLRESESRLNFLVSSTPVTIYTCEATPPYGATYISPNIEQLTGYKPAQFTENSNFWASNIHPEDSKQIFDNLPKLFKHGSHQHEYRFRMSDSSYRWMSDTLRLVYDSEGKPVEIIGYWVDINKRKHAEQEIETHKERLRRGQLFANIGTWDLNIQTKKLFWSERVGPLFGYQESISETTFDYFLASVHPGDRQKVKDAVTSCIEHAAEYNIEHRVVWPDGSIRWVHESGNVTRAKDGSPLHMLGVVQDITDRVAAELQQREIEKRFAFAVEGAGDGVWDWNMRTNVMQFSQLYMEMLGYVKNELPHHADTWINSVHPDDLERVQKNLQDYLEDRKPVYAVELRLRCKDDSYKWILCRGTVVNRDEQGKPIRMIGIHSDITERVNSENRLRDVEEHNLSLLNSAAEGIYGLDAKGKTTFANRAVCEMLGYTAKELIGKSMHSLVHHSYPDGSAYPRNKCTMYAAFTDGKVYKVDNEVLWRKDGSSFPVEYTSTPVKKEGKLVGAVVNFRDISERIKTEQALLIAKEEAESANRAKSQFLSSMSHELRTPMNAIMGFGQLLQMETDPALTLSQKENVDEIIKAGDHLLELINEVLDLAKIEAGRANISIESVTLGEVIAESMQLIMPLAKRRGISISLSQNGIDIEPDKLVQQHHAVLADRTRLRQVLLNLLSNAVKYNCDNGEIKINYQHSEMKPARIYISDTGKGITLGQQEQLFKSFNRLDADKTDIEGAGIGLVITKNLVEIMDGSIGMESQPGMGSTFWFELPVSSLLPGH